MTTPLQRTSLGELGGYNPLLSTSLGELGDAGVIPPPFTPDDVPHPPGTGEDAEARWRRIMVEDELLMLVIQTWLTLKDRE